MRTAAQRRQRLQHARLYFVTDAGVGDDVVAAALAGGVDLLQLRDPALDDEQVVATATRYRELCATHDALLFVNDRPDLALRCEADGVHVGQDDAPVGRVRDEVGDDLLVGLSTHSPDQLEAGVAAGADQLSVGPVWETPTKPGRPATGLDYVRAAARRHPELPWFAIGGIDEANIDEVVAAGAGRCVVVRAIRDAADPEAVARGLRATLEGARVGATQ